MVSATRLTAVIERRIKGASIRGDIDRKKKLCSILGAMKAGAVTPGQALMDLRFKPPAVKTPAVVRLPGAKPFTPRRRRRFNSALKGGL